MTIALDFDGTCVTHEFPEIGKNIGAVPVLKCLIRNGHNLVLDTMRCARTGHRDTLSEAVAWFKEKEIPLHGVNMNPDQRNWTTSPKVYAELYIDDAALGIPLVFKIGMRPFVDWLKVYKLLIAYDFITKDFLGVEDEIIRERGFLS